MVFSDFCNRASLPDVMQQTKQQDNDPQDSDGDEPEGVNASADFDRQMRAELIRVGNTLMVCARGVYSFGCVALSYIGCVCALI
jgi:demethoxyubiquinone hydroxylase (CLK1/Coq7/Cat5 family)